jgi:lambda family phage minor tail protein L
MNTLFKLNNYVVIDLFEIELEPNEGYLRFHGSKNFDKNIIFQNKEYIFIPCEFNDFETTSDGRQARPKLKVGNINNYFSRVLQDRGDLIGKNFNRKKILAKDLDDANFIDGKNPFGTSFFNTYIAFDKLIVNAKLSENLNFVELELVTKVDVESLTVPARKVTNDTCSWNYRCYGCNYGNNRKYEGPVDINAKISTPSGTDPAFNKFLGVPVADENDKVFIQNYSSFSNNGNYEIPSLKYKGEWLSTVSYAIGDFIYIDALSNTNLESDESILSPLIQNKNYFVCIIANSNKNPTKNTNLWKQDKCSKTLQGCMLRFGNNTTNAFTNGKPFLPFGAFPATFPFNNDTSV